MEHSTEESDDDGEGPSTEQQVQEALNNIPFVQDVVVEPRPCDVDEEQVVAQFTTTGCQCNKKCSTQFSSQYILEARAHCFDLSHGELDMVILGQLFASTNKSVSVAVESRHTEKERQKGHTTYYHAGKAVCIKTFRFLHTVGEKRLKNLQKNFKENGLTPRIHGNVHRRPKHSLSFRCTEYVVRFLLNYAEQHALLLPGRIPGYSRSDIKLLPSSISKRTVWRTYQQASGAESNVRNVAYSTFCRLWRTLLPSVIIMKPMSDLCWTCQQNSAAVIRMANCSEEEKSDALKVAEEHLRVVEVERKYYKSTVETCRQSVRAHYTVNGEFQPPPLSARPPNSVDISVHYSFDYAQQVHFPYNPQQPGPLYFLTPRKCSVFGMSDEALPRQVHFICDEAGECGKGANVVASRVHYFFGNLGHGEKTVYLHADNCTGQNKNSTVIHYLSWRTSTHRHTDITLSFLVVGHTKFAPDWCFGLFKRQFRRTNIGSLRAIAQVVNDSAECNVPQLVCDENGGTIVPTYDWTNFFAPHLKKLIGIKKYHHFRFTSSEPGVVYVKEHADTAEVRMDLNKSSPPWVPDKDELPSVVSPKGLSAERQWYLYDHIRPFCPDSDKDITCPLPTCPNPRSTRGTPARDATPAPDPDTVEPQAKRKRLCGTCRQEGHNSRSCPNKEM